MGLHYSQPSDKISSVRRTKEEEENGQTERNKNVALLCEIVYNIYREEKEI